MTLFTVDSSNVFGNGVAEAGKYNVKIANAMTRKASSGRQMLTLDYEVTDGKYRGGQIRYQTMTWVDDDEEKLEQSKKRFNTLVVALGVKDGVKIDSLEQLAKSVMGKTLSVTVDWAEPNTKGNIYLEVTNYHLVDPDGSKPNGVTRPDSDKPVGKAASKPTKPTDPFANTGDSIDISDDDLPF